MALVAIMGASHAGAANNLNNHGGPTMQNPVKAFLIYWLPSGVVLDTTQTNGIGNFEILTQRFYNDVSATSWFNIATQYPGGCGANECVVANGSGAVQLGGAWVDSQAYPSSKGTSSNPLQDSDIQNEVQRAISQNHWSVSANSEFFVITGVFKSTGAGVVECNGGNCTAPGGFCAYHSNFGLNGGTALYGYLSDASFNTAGCSEGISTGPNGQLSSDREVALMSHEFMETVTDETGNAWWDSSTGNEIGDNDFDAAPGKPWAIYLIFLKHLLMIALWTLSWPKKLARRPALNITGARCSMYRFRSCSAIFTSVFATKDSVPSIALRSSSRPLGMSTVLGTSATSNPYPLTSAEASRHSGSLFSGTVTRISRLSTISSCSTNALRKRSSAGSASGPNGPSTRLVNGRNDSKSQRTRRTAFSVSAGHIVGGRRRRLLGRRTR